MATQRCLLTPKMTSILLLPGLFVASVSIPTSIVIPVSAQAIPTLTVEQTAVLKEQNA